MVDKRSIKLSPYEFFCKYRNRRSVAVITDKQYIFYSQILGDDYRTHDNIVVDIETTIHPNSLREGWDAFRSNNLYTFGVGTGYFRIDFPDNKELSMNQVTFLLELLNEIDKYNQEANDNSKINLQCCNSKALLDFLRN